MDPDASVARLAALGHPLRARILAALTRQPATIADLARATARPPGTVAHHVGRLERAGFLEVVRVRRVRAVVERTYGVTALVDDYVRQAIGSSAPGVAEPGARTRDARRWPMQLIRPGDVPAERSDPMHFTGGIWAGLVLDEWPHGGPKIMWCHWDPGSRTTWHRHPRGQILHVTDGSGLVQVRGERARRLGPGDVVYAAPEEEHWHGAAPDNVLVYLSIMEGVTTFGSPEERVPDEVYLAGFREAEAGPTGRSAARPAARGD